jgi:acyl-[acyl-carrier-protein]-phospholipid O-acyltransferase/long-chain-fatty-acid--[acyl-carrier-protein] ligase
VVVSLPGPFHGHLLGFWGSLVVLIMLGVFAGMYATVAGVHAVAPSPEGQNGMIAVMNQANFAAILLSSGVYWVFDRLVVAGICRGAIFAMTAVAMLTTVLLYRPQAAAGARADGLTDPSV